MNGNARPPVHQVEIVEKGLAILGSYISNFTFPAAIRLVESGQLDLAPMITRHDRDRRHGRRHRPAPVRRGREDRDQALTRTDRGGHPMTAAGMRIASAPVSFGVDEIMQDDAWMPAPDDMLDWMVDIGFDGDRARLPGLHGRRGRRSASDCRRAAWSSSGRSCPSTSAARRRSRRTGPGCASTLRLMADGSPAGSRPFAVLSDHFDEPDRRALSGRIAAAPRDVARRRRASGRSSTTSIASPRPAARPGSSRSSIPTPGPTSRPPTRSPGSWTRSTRRCSGCAWTPAISGSAARIRSRRHATTANVIRHVHIKDCRTAVMDAVKAEGGSLDEALVRGVFCPLGLGDAGIDAVIAQLRANGYAGWLVIEQDQALRSSDTPASVVAGQRDEPRVPARARPLIVAARASSPSRVAWRSGLLAQLAGAASTSRWARRKDAVASTRRSTSSVVWAPVRKPRIM